MNWTTLVSCEKLHPQLGAPDLVLVDARFVFNDPQAGEAAWERSRLPGAGYVDLDRDLSNNARPAGQGRHPLPDAAAFTATVSRLGIRPQSQVVVYDFADGAMAAARFWWLLRLLGHARVAVLDGGFARWTTLGLPVETGEPLIHEPAPTYPAGDFAWVQVAQTDEIESRLGEGPGWLIDARAGERYRGEIEPIDRVAGHIPGALNRPYGANLADGVFLPPAALREQFLALIGDRDPASVVHHCGSGVTACHNLLAMEVAGLLGARVYAPSWSGWIDDPSRPIANGGDP
jgi:thiosulfate/3-mercaptopyruvate sulfurtransferase